jgi:hypothetical protein
VFLILTGVDEGMGQSEAHDQYADEQLQNLQKRIFLIEFLRLGFVFVYQGGYRLRQKITPLLRG